MRSMAFFNDQGRRVSLGMELGRGGEAGVYSVEGEPELVAKIYHQPPDPEKTEKLSQMVKLKSERLLALAAWPVGTLFMPGSKSMAGFLMKNVNRFKDIHLLYNPKSRTREFPPKANWRFLIHTAANVARAFVAVHDHGHVIGDVNQSNVRVSAETAIVNLLDCDSFQISANGKIYPCEVGVPLYTPPELQNTEFREVIRRPNHDNFGLAVLIFHLLFMGRHPFAGKFFGRGEMPIEKAIAEERFAFSRDVQRTQMLPPPACITLAHLPEEIGDLFTSAFGSPGAPAGRPDGKRWIAELDTLASRLIICSTNKAHLYFNGLPSCPWCPIESSGVLLFVDYTIVDTATGFSIDVIWSRILAFPSPGEGKVPSMLTYISGVEPSARATAAARKRKYSIAALAVAGFVALGYAVLSDDGLGYMFILVVFLVPILGALKDVFDWGGGKEFGEAARAAEARLRHLQLSWRNEASGDGFNVKLEELRTLTEEYRKLPERRKQKVRELERALYDSQLRHYLEQFDIAAADIPHIKDGRKAMLSAYGIDNAADVTRPALEAVPGFAHFLISQLITWRKSLEATFKFNPGRGVDPLDIQRVNREIAKRRVEIEALLSKGPSELNDLRRRIIAARGRLQIQLEKALLDVAQAQADERAAA
jgi:DNA-binding helix-hairpin-helix protein with protein kinase domain